MSQGDGMFGFFVFTVAASAILVALVLGLYFRNSFSSRDDALANCRLVNAQIEEVNKRAPAINALLRVTSKDSRARQLLVLRRSHVERVPLTDCEATFKKPWPF